ncbi:penicillin-binding protein activator [Avibacterium volantium]|uniref:Penicillin-binding protein activator LpoA n=1 Tax=Avibacterium volantium TaxID=762 RepID=A0A3S4H5T3_AVIVO|nr:penicillin-binding protein activator [Avibacterium volantium]VEB24527.1 Penicillin-binding protein activator LpoA precursor [Avibacterium volantium]
MTILLQRINLKNRLMPFLFALVLAGCTNLFGNSFTSVLKNDANASSEYYINQIQRTQNLEDQQTYKLLAARVLVRENKIPQAQAMLAELNDLNEEQLLDKAIIEAHIAAVKGNNKAADTRLKAIDLALLSPSQKARYYEVVARVAKNRNQIMNAVKARIQIDSLLTDTQRKQENNDRTWALLRNANRGLINNTSAEGSAALGGWLALTKAYNDNLNHPAQLSQALQSWKAAYPRHSASYLFPTELQGLFNFQQTQLNQVALLLPLSGDAQIIGSTIKRGFDDARGGSDIQVKVFDTLATPVESIIEQAKLEGISTVVGPLLKQNVDKLTNRPDLLQGLNVLTLNSTANSRAIGQLCYYGLAPEDEAESAANRIWDQGIQNPFIIVPQSDLGRRTASAFNTRWQQLSGTDANIKFYNSADDITYTLQSGLNQNIQALYIVATNNQLSDIKMAIDNSNINLKLFASSRSNSSNNTPEYRLLMNGLEFSDIPFFKDVDSAQYKKVAGFTNGDYSLMRLYAMGADAWLLINQFNELRQVPGFNINGLTGKLSAGPNCNIERDMTWYQYQNASVEVLSN